MDWTAIATAHADAIREATTRLRPAAEAAATAMVAALRAGGRILACGNGGSAADAQHFAAELVNRFLLEHVPYAAIALTTDSSVLTSIANDYAYDQVFSKQVQALGRPGDVLLAISTSGTARNVNEAARAARAIGMSVVALTGKTGGDLAPLASPGLLLQITATPVTARIQEAHELLLHALCQLVEETLAASPSPPPRA
ncbi:MAG: SIS domain-containing protein [Kiritimatiellae bacterium]|nr:SIS domain-containing protein [Kiritimatiellia bacterium]